jgi:hypothetical protein
MPSVGNTGLLESMGVRIPSPRKGKVEQRFQRAESPIHRVKTPSNPAKVVDSRPPAGLSTHHYDNREESFHKSFKQKNVSSVPYLNPSITNLPSKNHRPEMKQGAVSRTALRNARSGAGTQLGFAKWIEQLAVMDSNFNVRTKAQQVPPWPKQYKHKYLKDDNDFFITDSITPILGYTGFRTECDADVFVNDANTVEINNNNIRLQREREPSEGSVDDDEKVNGVPETSRRDSAVQEYWTSVLRDFNRSKKDEGNYYAEDRSYSDNNNYNDDDGNEETYEDRYPKYVSKRPQSVITEKRRPSQVSTGPSPTSLSKRRTSSIGVAVPEDLVDRIVEKAASVRGSGSPLARHARRGSYGNLLDSDMRQALSEIHKETVEEYTSKDKSRKLQNRASYAKELEDQIKVKKSIDERVGQEHADLEKLLVNRDLEAAAVETARAASSRKSQRQEIRQALGSQVEERRRSHAYNETLEMLEAHQSLPSPLGYRVS